MGILRSLSLLTTTAASTFPVRTSTSRWLATFTSLPFSSRRATEAMKVAPGTSLPPASRIMMGQLAELITGRPRLSAVARGAVDVRST